MTALDWVYALTGSWLLASVLLAPRLGAFIQAGQGAQPAAPAPDLLADAPWDVLSTDEQVRRLEHLWSTP